MPELYTTVQDGTDNTGELTDIFERLDKNKYFSEAMFGLSGVDNRKDVVYDYNSFDFGDSEDVDSGRLDSALESETESWGSRVLKHDNVRGFIGDVGKNNFKSNPGTEYSNNYFSHEDLYMSNDWFDKLSEVDVDGNRYPEGTLLGKMRNTETKMSSRSKSEHGQFKRFGNPYKAHNTMG